MKTALAVILLLVLLLLFSLFAVSAVAQDQSAVAAAEAACGPNGVEFRIKIDNSQHPVPQPNAGKAMVYVIEDQKFLVVRSVTARVGLDGAWVGANRGNSYLFSSIEPGEHHLCSDWRSGFLPGGRLVSLAGVTAEAGKVYYFRVRTSGSPTSGTPGSAASLDLELMNADEGRLLVASSPWSNSEPRH